MKSKEENHDENDISNVSGSHGEAQIEMEEDRDQFEELSQICFNEDLKLIRTEEGYAVATVHGVAITDDDLTLNEVEDWLNDDSREYIFPDDEEEEPEEAEAPKCCFSGGGLEHFEGQDPSTWGNNPDPACTIEGARCCNYCNGAIVIPARIAVSQIIKKALSEKMEKGDKDYED